MLNKKLDRIRAMQEATNREAAESLALLERMTIAKQTGGTAVLTGAYVRHAVIAAVVAFGLVSKQLPRGFQVNGTGDKTPFYFARAGNHDATISDAELLAEARSGRLLELCAGFEKALTPQAQQFLIAAESGFDESQSFVNDETKSLIHELLLEAKEFARVLAEEGRVNTGVAALVTRAEIWEANHV